MQGNMDQVSICPPVTTPGTKLNNKAPDPKHLICQDVTSSTVPHGTEGHDDEQLHPSGVYECKEKKGVYLDCQTPHTIGTGGIPEGDKILAPKEPLVKPTLSSLGEGGSKSPKQSSNPSSKAFTPNKLHHRVPGRGQTIDRSSNPILNLFRSYKSKPKVPIIKRDKIELFLADVRKKLAVKKYIKLKFSRIKLRFL